jgi:hypothetical protein
MRAILIQLFWESNEGSVLLPGFYFDDFHYGGMLDGSKGKAFFAVFVMCVNGNLLF